MTLLLLNQAQTTGVYTPSLDDVGALIRARTRDANGTELGTFNLNTRPTDAEVDSFIGHALAEVMLRIPADEISDELAAFARRMVALRAAMAVELSYNPDRTDQGSAYERLRELYESGTQALESALVDAGVEHPGRLVVATLSSPYSGPAILDPLTAIALE